MLQKQRPQDVPMSSALSLSFYFSPPPPLSSPHVHSSILPFFASYPHIFSSFFFYFLSFHFNSQIIAIIRLWVLWGFELGKRNRGVDSIFSPNNEVTRYRYSLGKWRLEWSVMFKSSDIYETKNILSLSQLILITAIIRASPELVELKANMRGKLSNGVIFYVMQWLAYISISL